MLKKELVIALPKGRILLELKTLFAKIGFTPEADFYDEESRKLIFGTSISNIKIIKVRSFDVATFVKFGAADIGICGLDVLEEFSSPEIYRLFNLELGKCRLSIAAKKNSTDTKFNINFKNKSHVRVASKYVNLTNRYFAKLGIQDECIKLNGAMELAPHLNLCEFIVDLVSTGKTLEDNNLVEVEKIMDVTSYFIANKNSLKTKSADLNKIISLFDINTISYF